MAIKVLSIGKTKEKYLLGEIDKYLQRISKYARIQWIELNDVRKKSFKSVDDLKRLEAEAFLAELKPNTFVIGLDEKGKEFSSRDFSKKINTWTIDNADIAFVVGGAFGFNQLLYSRMNTMVSLSKMTLNHQMVRLLLVEQIYRGFSILNGEPYHND